MPARGNQSAPVRWSPVESGGVQWIQVDCSPVESTGLPTGLESTGVHRIANWTGVHRSPPDCQSSSLGGPILILAGTESSWSPTGSCGGGKRTPPKDPSLLSPNITTRASMISSTWAPNVTTQLAPKDLSLWAPNVITTQAPR